MLLNKSMREVRTKDSFFDRIYRKNNSQKSVEHAKISLKHLERFCEKAYNKNVYEVISGLKVDITKDSLTIYNFLDDLVTHLTSLKTKKGKDLATPTVKGYFNDSKLFLQYMGILIDGGMLKQYVSLPKVFKEIPKPVKIQELQLLIEKAKPLRKALYLTLLSSGMRLGETLRLRKIDFDLTEDPVRITIPAKIAKNRHSRITFISKEARAHVSDIILNLKNYDDLVFSSNEDVERVILSEEQYFSRLRKTCKLDDWDSGERRHRITIHKFRKWFISTAVKNGMETEYKNSIVGWSSFDETYHEFGEELAEAYRKVEPSLYITLEYQAQSQIQEKDKEIAKIKEQSNRIGELESHVDNVELNLSKKLDELRINKVEKLFQKLELDIRKANPRLANKIINKDWEDDVNNEKLKTAFSYYEILLENDGGIESIMQGEEYEKFIKELPKALKKDKKSS